MQMLTQLALSCVLGITVATPVFAADTANQADTPAEKSAGAVINDTLITAKAKAALLADPVVKGSTISVETSQGEVRLSGVVASQDEAKRAVETVRALDGVKSVRNDISVKP